MRDHSKIWLKALLVAWRSSDAVCAPRCIAQHAPPHYIPDDTAVKHSAASVVQLLMGLVRPAASAPTMRRHAWDVGHTVLGRAAMMLGVLNAILGIFIFVSGYGGEQYSRQCMFASSTQL
jgi:hypothetical protein